MEEPELIYPAVELALQIRDKNDVSYSNIAVGEAFKPKLDDAPISAKCFLRNSISKKTFGLESDLIYTEAIGKRYLYVMTRSDIKSEMIHYTMLDLVRGEEIKLEKVYFS